MSGGNDNAHGSGGGHGHGGAGFGAGLRQAAIVALLVGALIILHHFTVPEPGGIDPTVMLALGFVVLASYTIGQLVEIIKLPHITGYLAAGLIFGPAVAHYLPPILKIPPFDQGVLNENVIRQLGLLDSLAVALIALTAGGELKLDVLRKSLKLISAILSFQTVFVFSFVMLFFWLASGGIPGMQVPGFGPLTTNERIAWGAILAAVTIVGSPAATIAVINGSGAKGPVSTTVMSAVVFQDIVVVVTYSIISVVAGQAVGANIEGDVAGHLIVHILGSIVFGIVLGFVIAAYLQWIGKELLLFVVGLVYATTFLASRIDVDPVLLFIAAGFTASNFSKKGDDLIHTVERLSMPVYVVFFTLAGARLHLDVLMALAPFAIALFLVRGTGMFLGAFAGTRVVQTEPTVRKYVWTGFISQAGVALSLAAVTARSFGERGANLATLVVAGIALNEMIGPVTLKTALGLARELPGQRKDDPLTSTPPPAIEEERPSQIPEWPIPKPRDDVWGGAPDTASAKLNQVLYDLQADLQGIVRDIARGPLQEFRDEAEQYLRELRREFLRHHRRLAVRSRAGEGETVAVLLHAEESELAERWRGLVLGRSAKLRQAGWSPAGLVDVIDGIVESLPDTIRVPYEKASFTSQQGDTFLRRLSRFGLRFRRGVNRAFGSRVLMRELPLRDLARYHLSGEAPSRLEGIAALLVQSDNHLADRTRSLFDHVVRGYDDIASRSSEEGFDVEAALEDLRQSVETELLLAFDELSRMADDGAKRAAIVLGDAMRAVKAESKVFGTLDLGRSERRSSALFRRRMLALDRLTTELEKVRRASSSGYALLALELELVGLEARVKDALEEHVSRLENDVRGRAHVHADRVHAAIVEALQKLPDILKEGRTGADVVQDLRELSDAAERVVGAAARAAVQLRDQLSEEQTLAPLFDALTRASGGLTDHYEVSAGRLQRGEWRLPPAVGVVDVPLRDLVVAHVETSVAPKLLATSRAMASNVQPFASSLQELERLLAFNVELAQGELEFVQDEEVPSATRDLLREMITGALERNLGTIEGHRAKTIEWAPALGTQLRTAMLGGIEELRGQLLDGSISQARIDAMRRAAVGRRLMHRAEQLPGALASARAQVVRALRNVLGDERLDSLRESLGLPRPKESDAPLATSFALVKPRAQLPLVYRRLFAADALEASDVLTGRESEIARARAVLSGNTPGRLRAVALVGMDGVGKSALSSAIVRTLGWKNVKRVAFSRPATVEDVDRVLRDRGEGALVVLDGLHWLIATRPGGFAPLRRLVESIVEDDGKSGWLVHADMLVWQYASQAAPLEDAFPEVVRLRPLDPSELESAVLARHALSGYGLNIEAPGRSQFERLIARQASRVRRPYEAYFRTLHEASGGLVRDALRLWLASIEKVDDATDFVHVGPVPTAPVVALRRLPQSLLVQLYQIARQGWMNAEVHAWLFRTDPTTAEAQLANLAHLGLVDHDGEERVYRIAVHLRGAVVRALQERRWLT